MLLRGSVSRDGRSSRSRDRSRDVAGAMKRLLMNRGRVDGSLSQAVDLSLIHISEPTRR